MSITKPRLVRQSVRKHPAVIVKPENDTLKVANIKEHFDKLYEEYRKSPQRAQNVDRLRRRYSALTEKDLLKTFTI